MSKILEMQQIYKSFGKVDVLKGINFELEKGEVRALLELMEQENLHLLKF